MENVTEKIIQCIPEGATFGGFGDDRHARIFISNETTAVFVSIFRDDEGHTHIQIWSDNDAI